MTRPDPKAFFANWTTSEGSIATKMGQAVRNNVTKVRRRSNCCGNHGQPGC
jgi:hypothetical protein